MNGTPGRKKERGRRGLRRQIYFTKRIFSLANFNFHFISQPFSLTAYALLLFLGGDEFKFQKNIPFWLLIAEWERSRCGSQSMAWIIEQIESMHTLAHTHTHFLLTAIENYYWRQQRVRLRVRELLKLPWVVCSAKKNCNGWETCAANGVAVMDGELIKKLDWNEIF
jgi:hypothetical protein